jgi:hypothetical protein
MFSEQTLEPAKADAFPDVSKAGPAEALALAPGSPARRGLVPELSVVEPMEAAKMPFRIHPHMRMGLFQFARGRHGCKSGLRNPSCELLESGNGQASDHPGGEGRVAFDRRRASRLMHWLKKEKGKCKP